MNMIGMCGHDVRFCTCGQTPRQRAQSDAEILGTGFILVTDTGDIYLPPEKVIMFLPRNSATKKDESKQK